MVYLKLCHFGKVTGVFFIDLTTLKVCHNHRIAKYKMFKHILPKEGNPQWVGFMDTSCI